MRRIYDYITRVLWIDKGTGKSKLTNIVAIVSSAFTIDLNFTILMISFNIFVYEEKNEQNLYKQTIDRKIVSSFT